MTAVLESSGLTKRYGEQVAVDHVDLSVRTGEIYGFLGPNGAGKTTTLRMALGLIRPTRGRIEVLGRTAGDPRTLHRIGAMVEGPAFYPYLSGRDNLRVCAEYSGARAGRVDAVLARVELTDRADDRFAAYSLGMKQRLGVAAALLNDPELVILDEPTNGLDPAGMRDMRSLIAALRDDGRTVVLSSHLMAEVEQVCDRVGVIANGRLVAESRIAELRGDGELHLTVSRLSEAEALVTGLPGIDDVRRCGPVLRVESAPDRTPDIVRALAGAGIDVHEVRRVARDLEDIFFEITGGSADAALPSHPTETEPAHV